VSEDNVAGVVVDGLGLFDNDVANYIGRGGVGAGGGDRFVVLIAKVGRDGPADAVVLEFLEQAVGVAGLDQLVVLVIPDGVTAKWLEGIGPKLRTALEKFGLLDAARMAALRPLTEHVNGTADEPGWRQYLASKGSTPLHVDRYAKSVLRAMAGSGAVYWSDISATRLMAWLHEQRADEFDAKGRRTRAGSARPRSIGL